MGYYLKIDKKERYLFMQKKAYTMIIVMMKEHEIIQYFNILLALSFYLISSIRTSKYRKVNDFKA